MTKFRNAESYYGNTPEMIKHQRANLIPGNTWQKRRTQDIRLNCWWENDDLETKQFIFEVYENKRDIEDMPKKELKSEEYLDNWWGELGLEDKKHIYKAMMEPLTPEAKAPILEYMQECLERKLALFIRKGIKRG